MTGEMGVIILNSSESIINMLNLNVIHILATFPVEIASQSVFKSHETETFGKLSKVQKNFYELTLHVLKPYILFYQRLDTQKYS